jgi:hypothetical protein
LVEPWDDLRVTAKHWPGGPPTDPAGWAASPAELAGTANDLADRLARIPTGRLIVIGQPGVGKTMLLIRLVLDLLADRQTGAPVPVLVPLAGWNPVDQDLPTWLAERLIVDHPALAEPAPPGAGPVSRARALWDERLLLPILDGLDELPEGTWSRAVTSLNDALIPLILASRPAAYQQAVTPTDPAADLPVRVRGAAGISLRPLAPDDVRDYLRRDAASQEAAARWKPVLATLDTSAPVAEALATPLLVGLARAIYNPRPGEHTGALRDPAELCDATQFPTSVAIQEHLFDEFIPAAYRPHPDSTNRCPWTGKQAKRWLVFLAQHLERQGTSDLAWWEFYRTTSRVVGLVVGLGVGLLVGPLFGLLFGLGVGLLVGPLFGLGVGLASWEALSTVPSPARGLRWNLRNPRGGRAVGVGLGGVIGCGLLFGLGVGLGVGFVAGVVFGVLGGFLVGLFSEPAGLAVAPDPQAVYARDRATYWTFGLVWGLGVGLGVGLLSGLLFGLGFGFGVGLVLGLMVGLLGPISWTAFVPFAIARFWQALGRHIPWRLMSFLADAHQKRGVLRQAGAVYQFRHIDLQHRLARRPGS